MGGEDRKSGDYQSAISPLMPRDGAHELRGGGRGSLCYEIWKGQVLRIVDLEGNQAVDTLFYNAHDYAERYSAQDTIRAQGNIYLTTGTRLISTEGNVLLTITEDTCGRHDTLGGACSAESNTVRYASKSATCTPAATTF